MRLRRRVTPYLPFSVVGGSHKKGLRSLQANFTTLIGAQFYDFRFKKHEPLTFYYDITVHEGTLHMRVSSNSETFFEQTFTENQQGSIEITPSTKRHVIILDGKQFKGRCECEFTLRDDLNTKEVVYC